jgi:hypothetical protein
MSFIWTPVSVGTTVTAGQLNEVKTNADTLASNLGISLTWNELPVSADDRMTVSQVDEIQSNLDIIDSSNICSAENVARHTSDNPDHNETADAGDDSVVDNSQLTGNNASEDGTYQSDHDSSIDNDQNTGYDSSDNGTILSGEDTGYDISEDGTVQSSNHTPVCGSNYSSQNGLEYISYS